jgi:hypothetical protein
MTAADGTAVYVLEQKSSALLARVLGKAAENPRKHVSFVSKLEHKMLLILGEVGPERTNMMDVRIFRGAEDML